jgi:hypothetical protein
LNSRKKPFQGRFEVGLAAGGLVRGIEENPRSCQLSTLPTAVVGRVFFHPHPMSSPDLLVLGLLLLASNLTLCALFAPAKPGPTGAHHLVRLWKLLGLALLQIGSWSVVLDQGGATQDFSDSFLRTASLFGLMGGYYEGAALMDPWNALAPLIALNGLLFIPVALVPILFPSSVASSANVTGANAPQTPAPQPAAPQSQPLPNAVASEHPAKPAEPAAAPATPLAQPAAYGADSTPAPSQPVHTAQPVNQPTAATAAAAAAPPPGGGVVLNPAASPLVATLEDLPEPAFGQPAADPNRIGGHYRPAVPKGAALTPAEAEYAAQMKPLGPTPPPIRFGRPS